MREGLLLLVNMGNAKHANTSIEHKIDVYSLKTNLFFACVSFLFNLCLQYVFSCPVSEVGLQVRGKNITRFTFTNHLPHQQQHHNSLQKQSEGSDICVAEW